MPLPVAIIAGLFAEIIITGGFHVDALADTADGLFLLGKESVCWKL